MGDQRREGQNPDQTQTPDPNNPDQTQTPDQQDEDNA